MTRRRSSLAVGVVAATLLIASPSTLPTVWALSKIAPAASGAPVANNTVTKIQKWLEDQVSALDVPHQLSARLYADVNVAEYKALLANDREKSSGKKANATAVAALAAYPVAVAALPFKQASLDELYGKLLAGLSDEDVRRAASVADPIAGKALRRSADNVAAYEYVDFKTAPSNEGRVGAYAYTPGQKFSLYPQLGGSKLTVLGGTGKELLDKDPDIKDKFSPLKPGTPEYDGELSDVERVGGNKSTARTPEQSAVAGFWADGSGTPTVAGHYLQIAASLLPENATLLQTAELFSRVAVAQYDAAVVAWALKYRDLFWRPITAIRRGSGGNGSSDWEPFLKTPPHPEYPSGHAVTSGASAEVLKNFYGRDDVSFETTTASKGYSPRNFSSFLASSGEVGDSRVWGGIHFNRSSVDGGRLGRIVARKTEEAFDKAVGGGA